MEKFNITVHPRQINGRSGIRFNVTRVDTVPLGKPFELACTPGERRQKF